MATLSRRTLAIVIEYLERQTRTSVETFFYGMNVPHEIVGGTSKLDMILNVFKELENFSRGEVLEDIVEEVYNGLQIDQDKRRLEQALIADGFVADDGTMAKDVPAAEENRNALIVLAETCSVDLNLDTLLHHLKEAEDLFREEKWDSAISHARNFVEQLLHDIATVLAKRKTETPDLSRPRKVREYLQHAGFFDESERKNLADGVYGFFSEEGSHPGISTQSTARVCMHILWAFGFYVLEKFVDWKQVESK